MNKLQSKQTRGLAFSSSLFIFLSEIPQPPTRRMVSLSSSPAAEEAARNRR
jgi:hypothetical protein